MNSANQSTETNPGRSNPGELLKRLAERRAKANPRLKAKYGTLSKGELDRILRAEEALEKCKGCRGLPCLKSDTLAHKPVIYVEEGQVRIVNVLCEYAQEARIREALTEAQLPRAYVGKKFKDYERTLDNAEALKLAKWYVAEKPPKSVYLYGGCGTGKTYLATLIGQTFIVDNKTVIFGDVPKLLGKIKAAFNGNGSAAEIVESYCKCDLLILDDLGTGQITDWSVNVLYEIINGRYNEQKAMVITSNYLE